MDDDNNQPTSAGLERSRRAFLARGLGFGAMAAAAAVTGAVAAGQARRTAGPGQTTAHGGALHTDKKEHGGVTHEHSGITHTHGVMVHALDEQTLRTVDNQQTSGTTHR